MSLEARREGGTSKLPQLILPCLAAEADPTQALADDILASWESSYPVLTSSGRPRGRLPSAPRTPHLEDCELIGQMQRYTQGTPQPC